MPAWLAGTLAATVMLGLLLFVSWFVVSLNDWENKKYWEKQQKLGLPKDILYTKDALRCLWTWKDEIELKVRKKTLEIALARKHSIIGVGLLEKGITETLKEELTVTKPSE